MHVRSLVAVGAASSSTVASLHAVTDWHALAATTRYCVVPSHASPHELSAVAVPAMVGFPLAWQSSDASVKDVCGVHELGFDCALKWPDTHLHVRSLVAVGAASSSTDASLHTVTDWHDAAPAPVLNVLPSTHGVHDVPATFSDSYPAAHSHTRSATLDSALSSCTLVSAHDRASVHALALESRYCAVPSHASPHELSVVLSPSTVGWPLAWHPSAANVVWVTHVLNVGDAASVSIMVPAPHSSPHALSVVLSPPTRGLPCE